MIMNNYSHFFNDDPWKGIEIGSYPSGRRLYLNDNRFWVSIDDRGRRLFFIHEDVKISCKVFDKLASLRIEVDDSYGDASRLLCTLLESDKESEKKFSIIAKNIAFSTSNYFGTELFLKVQSKIKGWSSFLKATRQGLTTAEYTGFIGELYFFKQYLLNQFTFTDAIRFWIGPEGKKQDITLNGTAIEIKTSLVGDARTIHISSLQQLEKVTSSLFLLHLIAIPTSIEFGFSLKTLYESCLELVKGDVGNEIAFLSKVSSLYGQASEEQLDSTVSITSETLYTINDGFPKLTSDNTSDGVISASYELSIAELKKFVSEQSIKEVIKNG